MIAERLRRMFHFPLRERHQEIMQEAECSKHELEHRQHELAQRVHVLEWITGLSSHYPIPLPTSSDDGADTHKEQ